MRNATLTKSNGLFFGGGKEGVGKGVQIYDVCVCHTAMIRFLLKFFFGGGGGGGDGALSFRSLLLYYIY